MRLILILFLLSSLSNFVIAQINLDSIINHKESKLIDPKPYPPKVYPDIYIQIDTSHIKLDTVSLKLIDPKWIKRVEIIKEEKYKELFGNSKPVLMIHPKKKHRKTISTLIRK